MTTITNRRAVLITGASTGIGAACAHHLDGRGFAVFAGVRKEADGAALQERSAGRITPVNIDVTDGAGVRRAAETVAGILDSAGLSGLVNNAGIVVAGPLEFLPLEGLRRQLETNVIGQIAVTQAFLPLLRKAKGRVVNMGSITGRVASPFLGPYSASKFAIEALTDALRIELRPWGIPVSVIEPGAIATPIWDKSSKSGAEQAAAFPPEAIQLYGESLAAFAKLADKLGRQAIPPERVARAVAHALTAHRPRTRYLVGRDAWLQALLWKVLPDRASDALLTRAMGLKRKA